MSRRNDFDQPTPGLPGPPPPPRGVVRSRTVTLTPAQLLALHTAPVVLVPVEDADAVIALLDVTAAQDAAASDGVATANPCGVGYAAESPWDHRELEIPLMTVAGRWVTHYQRDQWFALGATAVGKPVVLSMTPDTPITAAAGNVSLMVLYYLV